MSEAAVDHVIVVMLENRSFDHLLGYLDHPSPDFDGVQAGTDTNPLDPRHPELGQARASKHANVRLRVDPDHAHDAVGLQLGFHDGAAPRMDGFVRSYEEKATGKGAGPAKARRARRLATTIAAGAAVLTVVASILGAWWWALAGIVVACGAVLVRLRFVPKTDHFPGLGPRIMRCWDPSSLPAIATLARSFAVCTRWFSSVPGETWPNRQFVHAATSAGTVDIRLGLYEDRTVFELLEDSGSDWRIYYDGPAQVLCYPALWCGPERLANWHTIDHLFTHIDAETLPNYAFVEPNHGYVGRSYSQHPGNNRRLRTDFRHGDAFVAAIYEALRSRPQLFERTVLVVTYDEHGGTWDHVPPETTVAPDARSAGNFRFDRLGARVPALVISPRVPAGTVDSTVYDHSSIPATLRLRFAPSATPLTNRDAVANSFLHLASLDQSRSDLPDLSAHARRPKPARTPLDTAIGWLKELGRLEDATRRSLGWLAARFDEAVIVAPPTGGARGAPEAVRVDVRSARGPEAEPIAPRRSATRAVRKLERAAAVARATTGPTDGGGAVHG